VDVTGRESNGGPLTADRGTGGGSRNPPDAFDALVLGAYQSLARLAYLMSGDTATAEDIVAEAFARSWTPWQSGTVDEFGPYVRRTVINLCLQGQRRRLVERRALERFRARPETRLDEPGNGVPHLVDLRRALQALSVEHRAVVVLRFFADLSEQETAEELQLPIGTVKSRTSRALKALRPMIGGADYG
jgi:RNA polymerase sigma-70 factor (sigma-E family)